MLLQLDRLPFRGLAQSSAEIIQRAHSETTRPLNKDRASTVMGSRPSIHGIKPRSWKAKHQLVLSCVVRPDYVTQVRVWSDLNRNPLEWAGLVCSTWPFMSIQSGEKLSLQTFHTCIAAVAFQVCTSLMRGSCAFQTTKDAASSSWPQL